MNIELTVQDLQNIHACLATARVDGIQAAQQLIVLHHKVGLILQARTNGNGNGDKSDQPSADQPAPADDHGVPSN